MPCLVRLPLASAALLPPHIFTYSQIVEGAVGNEMAFFEEELQRDGPRQARDFVDHVAEHSRPFRYSGSSHDVLVSQVQARVAALDERISVL